MCMTANLRSDRRNERKGEVGDMQPQRRQLQLEKNMDADGEKGEKDREGERRMWGRAERGRDGNDKKDERDEEDEEGRGMSVKHARFVGVVYVAELRWHQGLDTPGRYDHNSGGLVSSRAMCARTGTPPYSTVEFMCVSYRRRCWASLALSFQGGCSRRRHHGGARASGAIAVDVCV